jgi:hypothetical protein
VRGWRYYATLFSLQKCVDQFVNGLAQFPDRLLLIVAVSGAADQALREP